MKISHKTVIFFLCASILLLAGCTGGAQAEKEVEGTLSEIMAQLNEAAGLDIVLYDTEVTGENAASFLGTNSINFKEALASEPMISAIPHSVVLVRLESGEDVEAAKTAIRDNADPAKWICVRVEPENVIVDSIGSLIMLVMSDSASAYAEAFAGLAS